MNVFISQVIVTLSFDRKNPDVCADLLVWNQKAMSKTKIPNIVTDQGPVAQKLKIKRKSQKSNASQKNQT